MYNSLRKDDLLRGINQGLKLHSSLRDLSSQCGVRNGQASAPEDSYRYSGDWLVNFASITWASPHALDVLLSTTWTGTIETPGCRDFWAI